MNSPDPSITDGIDIVEKVVKTTCTTPTRWPAINFSSYVSSRWRKWISDEEDRSMTQREHVYIKIIAERYRQEWEKAEQESKWKSQGNLYDNDEFLMLVRTNFLNSGISRGTGGSNVFT